MTSIPGHGEWELVKRVLSSSRQLDLLPKFESWGADDAYLYRLVLLHLSHTPSHFESKSVSNIHSQPDHDHANATDISANIIESALSTVNHANSIVFVSGSNWEWTTFETIIPDTDARQQTLECAVDAVLSISIRIAYARTQRQRAYVQHVKDTCNIDLSSSSSAHDSSQDKHNSGGRDDTLDPEASLLALKQVAWDRFNLSLEDGKSIDIEKPNSWHVPAIVRGQLKGVWSMLYDRLCECGQPESMSFSAWQTQLAEIDAAAQEWLQAMCTMHLDGAKFLARINDLVSMKGEELYEHLAYTLFQRNNLLILERSELIVFGDAEIAKLPLTLRTTVHGILVDMMHPTSKMLAARILDTHDVSQWLSDAVTSIIPSLQAILDKRKQELDHRIVLEEKCASLVQSTLYEYVAMAVEPLLSDDTQHGGIFPCVWNKVEEELQSYVAAEIKHYTSHFASLWKKMPVTVQDDKTDSAASVYGESLSGRRSAVYAERCQNWLLSHGATQLRSIYDELATNWLAIPGNSAKTVTAPDMFACTSFIQAIDEN
jgi:hypothetical protein